MIGSSKDVRLVALHVVSNGALLQGEKLPTRLQVMKWGVNESVQGPFSVDAALASSLDEVQKAIGRQEIAIDYEHNTVPGTPEYNRSQEPRPVAGYGTPRVVPGEGVFLENITWTPDGEKTARNYKDLSPAPWVAKNSNRCLALHSVALTRNGAIHDLTFHSTSLELAESILSKFDAASGVEAGAKTAPSAKIATHNSMSKNKPLLLEGATLIALSALLGLPENSKSEDVTKELAARLAVETQADAEIPELKTLSASVERLEKLISAGNGADLKTLSAQIAGFEKMLKDQTVSADKAERTRLLADAATAGKLVPLSAATIETMPTATLRELIGGLQSNVVPLSARGKARDGKMYGDAKGLSLAIAAHTSENSSDPAYARRN